MENEKPKILAEHFPRSVEVCHDLRMPLREFTEFVQAIEEKSEYLYRVSLFGCKIQFFEKVDVVRSPFEIMMLKKYYCRNAEGLFVTNSHGLHTIIINGMQYQRSTRPFRHKCTVESCTCWIDWTILDSEFRYCIKNGHNHDSGDIADDPTTPTPKLSKTTAAVHGLSNYN